MKIFTLKLSDHSIEAKSKYVMPFAYSLMSMGLFFAVYYYLKYHAAQLAITCAGAATFALVIPIVNKKLGNLVVTANIIVLIHFVNVFFLITQTGGIHASAMWWLLTIPLIASFLLNSFFSFLWHIVITSTFIYFYLLEQNSSTPISILAHANLSKLVFTSLLLCSSLTTILCILADTLRERTSIQKEVLMLNAVKLNNMANLGEMASSIAHEINNPLTVIKVLNSKLERMFIEKSFTETEILEILAKTERHINRIESITGLMGNLSSTAQRTSKFTEFLLLDIFLAIRNIFEDRLTQNNINLEINTPYDITLKAPQAEFYQAFYNIIKNAIEELELDIHKNKVKVIKINTELLSNKIVRVEISDNGNGISEQMQQKIFNPFYTTKSSNNFKGFGLAFAYNVFQSNNAEICYVPNENGGRFRVEINI
jgi:two-component system NtrC family sensor kinase